MNGSVATLCPTAYLRCCGVEGRQTHSSHSSLVGLRKFPRDRKPTSLALFSRFFLLLFGLGSTLQIRQRDDGRRGRVADDVLVVRHGALNAWQERRITPFGNGLQGAHAHHPTLVGDRLDEGFCSLRVGIFGKGVGRSSPHRRDIVFGQGVEGKEPDTSERNKADA